MSIGEISQLADGPERYYSPSRRPDYEIGYERPTARLLATLAAIEPYDYYPLS
jgi:hypothetical protein